MRRVSLPNLLGGSFSNLQSSFRENFQQKRESQDPSFKFKDNYQNKIAFSDWTLGGRHRQDSVWWP